MQLGCGCNIGKTSPSRSASFKHCAKWPENLHRGSNQGTGFEHCALHLPDRPARSTKVPEVCRRFNQREIGRSQKTAHLEVKVKKSKGTLKTTMPCGITLSLGSSLRPVAQQPARRSSPDHCDKHVSVPTCKLCPCWDTKLKLQVDISMLVCPHLQWMLSAKLGQQGHVELLSFFAELLSSLADCTCVPKRQSRTNCVLHS